jgi:ribose 5-phosphate isomerase RpiB
MIDKELVGQIVREVLSQSRSATAPAKPAAAAAKPRSPSRPVISADDIRRLARNATAVELPRNAIITPLANDLILQRKLTVKWLDGSTGQTAEATAAPIALIYDQNGIAVQEVIRAATKDHLPLTVVETDLVQAIDRTAQEIQAGRSAGAIVLVQEPYFALCYANKLKGLRAAPAGDWKSIARAMETINANVLVIDYPTRGFYQLWQMVRSFVQLRTAARKPGIHQPQIEGKE